MPYGTVGGFFSFPGEVVELCFHAFDLFVRSVNDLSVFVGQVLLVVVAFVFDLFACFASFIGREKYSECGSYGHASEKSYQYFLIAHDI